MEKNKNYIVDENVIIKCTEGDEEAFNEIYEKYYNFVYFQAYNVLQNQDASEDVLQETFVTVCNEIKKLKEPKAFHNWIKQITYSKTMDYIRKNGKLKTYSDQIMDQIMLNKPCEVRETNIEDNIVREGVFNAIKKLPMGLRKVAFLYFHDNLEVNEISHKIGISSNLVSVRINRAKKRMSKELEKNGVTPSIYNLSGFTPLLMFKFLFSKDAIMNVSGRIMNTFSSVFHNSASGNETKINKLGSASNAASMKGVAITGVTLMGVAGVTYVAMQQRDVVRPVIHKEKAQITDIKYSKGYTNKEINIDVEAIGEFTNIHINGKDTITIFENGEYNIQILKGNEILDEKKINIKNIDTESPIQTGYEVNGNEVTIFFQEDLSGINANSIKIKGLKNSVFRFDKERKALSFEYDMKSNVYIEIGDVAGNYTDVYLDMTE